MKHTNAQKAYFRAWRKAHPLTEEQKAKKREYNREYRAIHGPQKRAPGYAKKHREYQRNYRKKNYDRLLEVYSI